MCSTKRGGSEREIQMCISAPSLDILQKKSIQLLSGRWAIGLVLGTFTDRDWIENFRVSKKTFYMLCDIKA